MHKAPCVFGYLFS